MTDKKKDDTNLSNNKLYNDKLNGKKEEMLNAARNEKMMAANIEYIIEKEEKLKEKLKNSSHLERFTTDVTLFISLVKDYSQGNYREIPYKTISAVVLGLLYILNPIDIIPDFIPVIGYIDDALVIAFCLKMVEKDLQNYQTWKQEQSSTDGTADSNVNE
ncbi:YkvA family protein [Psychrobacter frigidicola]|uniref:YkvA family protein n=1 Tax=Psychrobacter frigidicola TaxID=45611 RepID=UPI0039B79310